MPKNENVLLLFIIELQANDMDSFRCMYYNILKLFDCSYIIIWRNIPYNNSETTLLVETLYDSNLITKVFDVYLLLWQLTVHFRSRY